MDTKRKRIARLEVQAPDPEAERVQTLLAQLPTCAIRWVSELVKKANAGLELDSAETEEIEHLGKLLGGELDWECQGKPRSKSMQITPGGEDREPEVEWVRWMEHCSGCPAIPPGETHTTSSQRAHIRWEELRAKRDGKPLGPEWQRRRDELNTELKNG